MAKVLCYINIHRWSNWKRTGKTRINSLGHYRPIEYRNCTRIGCTKTEEKLKDGYGS